VNHCIHFATPVVVLPYPTSISNYDFSYSFLVAEFDETMDDSINSVSKPQLSLAVVFSDSFRCINSINFLSYRLIIRYFLVQYHQSANKGLPLNAIGCLSPSIQAVMMFITPKSTKAFFSGEVVRLG